jgi:hypothetical protein
MKKLKSSALAWVLFAVAISLSAQDYRISSVADPAEASLFNPESGLYRASMGTVRSDIDGFMDVGTFRDTSFESMLTYVGFDPQGITLGAGIKLGSDLYFGAAYGGSLIQDLFSRVTNQDPSELSLKLDSSDGSTTEVPGVFDSVGGRPAETKNRNEFNLFLGFWRVGLKLGFSQMLTVAQPQSEDAVMYPGQTTQGFSFENAMVPSLALGASIPIGESLFVIPELSAQLDIHQFVNGEDPHTKQVGNTFVPDFYSGYTQIYNEAKVGADLGIVYRSPGGEIRVGGGYYLKKRVTGFDIGSGAAITHVVVDDGMEETIVSTYDNLEQEIVPYFLYSGAIGGGRGRFGLKLLVDMRFNEYYLTPDSNQMSYGDYEKHAKEIYVKPELNLGGTFDLLPKRFALHAGFGLNLYTFKISEAENTSLDESEASMEEFLPSTRFAVGFTVNLTATTTIDMLLITSGDFDFKSDQDNNKFTLFLTMKW